MECDKCHIWVHIKCNRINLQTYKFLQKSPSACEMDVMKLRDNTMVCGCTTKITLIHGVIKLSYGIRLEYCKDSACDLLQMLNLWM